MRDERRRSAVRDDVTAAPGSPTPITDACHDITVYEALDLAAGACEGNGLLIDISDPANPKRIDAVADPLFAYWHGATFSNDGKKVFFTDEWGGGTAARCRATDQLSWGANAIYEIVNRKLVFRSYYKLPVAQTAPENCVSHIGVADPGPGPRHLGPGLVPGRRVAGRLHRLCHPKEIGYFDRGPINATSLVLGGFWSTYWYNGKIYGSEIARGFDCSTLKPTADLTAARDRRRRFGEVRRVSTRRARIVQRRPTTPGGVGGNVPATLSLSLAAPAQFGAFTPGVARRMRPRARRR